ncbi:hypothetical protein BKA93DRAFT_750710 [Sparassis latifolia]
MPRTVSSIQTYRLQQRVAGTENGVGVLLGVGSLPSYAAHAALNMLAIFNRRPLNGEGFLKNFLRPRRSREQRASQRAIRPLRDVRDNRDNGERDPPVICSVNVSCTARYAVRNLVAARLSTVERVAPLLDVPSKRAGVVVDYWPFRLLVDI